jgi:hypothetical protein
MFFALLIVTLLVAVLVSFVVARAFSKSILTILDKIVGPEMAAAWAKYMTFAIYVVGISGGVRIYALEQYLAKPDVPGPEGQMIPNPHPALTPERWVLEVYRTIIETMQAVAWMLLVFFLFALIAYVIVRIWGNRKKDEDG